MVQYHSHRWKVKKVQNFHKMGYDFWLVHISKSSEYQEAENRHHKTELHRQTNARWQTEDFLIGNVWPQNYFFSSAANSGQNKGIAASSKENIEVPPILPGENSSTHFRSVRVLQSNPGKNHHRAKLKWQSPSQLIMGNFAICKTFEMYKSLTYSMTFIPSMNYLLCGGNFCPPPEGKKEGGYQNSYSWHKHFITQSTVLLDSEARFTERPGDWGMAGVIWRTFKSSVCMTHKRGHIGEGLLP